MIAPMLAHKYQDKRKYVKYPLYVQPKLNGIRCQHQNGKLQSRSHGLEAPRTWHESMLSHIRASLEHLPPNIMLDGELYVHGWSLQKINGAASVGRVGPKEETALLEYHVFDMFDENAPILPYEERQVELSYYGLHNKAAIKLVDTHYVVNELHMEQLFKYFKDQGYEGAMLRDKDAPYGQPHLCGNKENRWPCLLKRKDWLDITAQCLEFEITTGEKGERGFDMTCRLPSGVVFHVGSGLSHSERDAFELSPPIGEFFDIKYEMLSDSGKPLKPTILQQR